MTNYERERLAKLMEDKTYFYSIEKFKRVFFYYRYSNDRLLRPYQQMMDEKLYSKLKSIKSKGFPQKIERFEFNEDNLKEVKEGNSFPFRGIESFNNFLDFYLDNLNKINFNVNQLIIGPVGTDKRNLIKRITVEIVNNELPNVNEIVFEKFIHDEYNKHLNQRIFFSSFNNYSYSDYIEHIDQNGKIIDGIFKKICRVANNNVEINARSFIQGLEKRLKKFFSENNENYFQPEKHSNESSFKFKLIDNKVYYAYSDNVYKELTEKIIYDRYIDSWFGQTHERSTFIETLKHLFEGLELNHELKNPLDKYVLIIDNFNEGNLNEIFGDVFPLLGIKQRNGEVDSQKIILKNSKETFYIPDNVFILAILDSNTDYELNTKTRSLFKIHFVNPDPSEIFQKNINGIDLVLLLESLNNKIEFILGRNYMFGQNFFYRIDDFKELKNVFNTQFIPLLENYTSNDKEIISSILGSDFYVQTKIGDKTFKKLKPIEDWSVAMFENIYNI